MNLKHGVFTISLDFELYWGMIDKKSIYDYKYNLHGVSNAIPKMLRVFCDNNIHATWATVGFLIEKYDNLNTYPIHQMAKAFPLMKAALDDIKEKRINIKNGVHPSRLWYHPTLFEYVKNWVLKGVL